ncbi:hypothetical protein IFM89_007022 [Coptis chinensis]|uniref:CWZF3/5/7 THD domain-containing protein n=1 Tax=Coptis chinensis TaxID=261450 RepID=A0A835M7N3_9MAGN|nr:hypothetical protein IFM89_007022 [Coptis chinensis]
MLQGEEHKEELEEGELEESEARALLLQYESNLDPDAEFSYMDDRIQSIFGNFKNDFEDGGFKENLGAKYGMYGSFLQSYAQPPSEFSCPRTLQNYRNRNKHRYPNSLPAKTANFISSTRRGRTYTNSGSFPVPRSNYSRNTTLLPFSRRKYKKIAPFSVPRGNYSDAILLTTPEFQGFNYSSKEIACLSLSCGTGVSAKHVTIDNSSLNQTEQNLLKNRTKTGRVFLLPEEEPAICYDLGFHLFPSSLADVPGQSRVCPLETQVALYELPLGIIECMTSFPVLEECLLSPISNSILCCFSETQARLVIPTEVASLKVRKKTDSVSMLPILTEELYNELDLNASPTSSELETTGLYFQAALKLFRGAFLLERSNYDSAELDEITSSMLLYRKTATLCEFVAYKYERCKEMAAAALAYKCMEVASMRIVYFISSVVSKDRHNLQMGVVNSRPDVYNMKNQGIVEKIGPQNAVDSDLDADHTIVAGDLDSYERVLNYIENVLKALEATTKYINALEAAIVGQRDAENAKAISSVQRVIEYSFQDIEELICLIWLALEAINHKK